MTSWGSIPSTVHPTDWAVPSTSFIVPENSLAMERGAITRAAAMMSSMEMLPLCWMFFTFLRSLGGSFSALMTRAAAEGTTEQASHLLCCPLCCCPGHQGAEGAPKGPQEGEEHPAQRQHLHG